MPKAEKRPEEKNEKNALLSKILDKYKVSAKFPGYSDDKITFSREYKIFKKEEVDERKKTAYEKFCGDAEKMLKIMPDPVTKIKLEAAIKFTGLNVTPSGAASFAVLSGLILFLIFVISLAIPIPFIFKFMIFVTSIAGAYLLYTYPMNLANRYRVESGSDVVMAVLYMTILMKTNPTLEGALRFAANNVSGKVGKDFKKILWEVESGRYTTVEEGLDNYLMQWKEFNKEFVESILLIRESMLESSVSRRETLLDKAVDVVLIGTDEKMKKYARELETPIMMLEGLGILLPVMGMIVFPLLTIFLAEEMKNIGLYLAVGYNIILPVLVYFFMNRTLEQRPATHTKIDISKHPDYIPGNNIAVHIFGKRESVPALPLAASISLILMLPGVNYMLSTGFFSDPDMEHGMFSMLMSVSIVAAIAVGNIFYNYASCFQKIGLRRKVSQIENEFEDALFALGTRIAGGTPIESAVVAAEQDTKQLEISDMFRIIMKNINRLSMTFKEALFDEKYGALQYYPSSLVKTVMKAVAESIQKGTRAASMSMLTISRYLRDIRSTQERIEDLLSSVVSSLKFQSFILIPVMSGVVVAVAQLMLKILMNLGAQFKTLEGTMPAGAGMGISGIFPTESAVSSEVLQLIIGIYVVEILTIMGAFISRIEFGNDEIEERDATQSLLIFGIIVYVATLVLVMAVFNPLITAISMSV